MGSPLRVLHAVVNMNRGGAETLIMNLYRNIDREKIQFDFLTSKPGAYDDEILKLGGKIYRVPYITEVGHFGYLKALNGFFHQHSHYKIVHSHMDKMSGLIVKTAKANGIPVRIAHSHNTQSEGNSIVQLYKWYMGRHIKKNASDFFACSTAAGSWLFKGDFQDTVIVQNGIEGEKFLFSSGKRRKIRNELQINENTLVLGHVGRFSKQKNHHFLLEVFSEVKKERPDSILLLVGDGSLHQGIKNKIHELDLQDNVLMLGVRSDVEDILQAFDVFVFPSLHEGLPVTLIEAQYAGLPCFISNTITNEVDLGVHLVKFLPLSNKNLWIQELSNFHISGSRALPILQTNSILTDYDVKVTAKKLETKYLALSG